MTFSHSLCRVRDGLNPPIAHKQYRIRYAWLHGLLVNGIGMDSKLADPATSDVISHPVTMSDLLAHASMTVVWAFACSHVYMTSFPRLFITFQLDLSMRFIGAYAAEFDGWLRQLSAAKEIAQAAVKRLSA